MGIETKYIWATEFNYDNNCNNEIEIEYLIWEYPISTFNYDDVKLVGATEISKYYYEFHEKPNYEDE